MSELYDQIGDGYTALRRPDPRIHAVISGQLQGVSTLLNVGAGNGSYEPEKLPVITIEPSARMISQRQDRSQVVQARAEALPFSDNSFDAATAVLTIHHWHNIEKGLEECIRVIRKRLVILTWDPESDGFWLQQDYFSGLLDLDRSTFPELDQLRKWVGNISVHLLPIPADCTDGFQGAYWPRPGAYIEQKVRTGMSSFLRPTEVERGLDRLRVDITSGKWKEKYGHLLEVDELDICYLLVVSEVQ